MIFVENPDSREIKNDPAEIMTTWTCQGIFDPAQAMAVMPFATPGTIDHPFAGPLFRSRKKSTLRENGWSHHTINVPYVLPGSDGSDGAVGEYEVTCGSAGGTINVKAGTHVAVYPPGKPTYNGLIGVKTDDVEGIDLPFADTKLTVRFTHPGGWITENYARSLEAIRNHVNNAPFMGRAAGSVRLSDWSLSYRSSPSSNESSASYEFLVSANLTNHSVGEINGINKDGHDVMWIRWQENVQANKSAPIPDHVNIVRVFQRSNLAAVLGFGG